MSLIVVPVKLAASKQDTAALVATLRACNQAAKVVSEVAWDRRIWRAHALQLVTYGTVRNDHGLGAQAAVHVIKKVADAYNSGKPEHRRAARFRRFRWSSAQPFDARNLSWDHQERTVSIWTVQGRVKEVRYACADWQAESLGSCPIGETDLVFRRGSLYLYATVEVADAEMADQVAGWLGVDLGIVNPAVTSDGECLPFPIRQPGPRGRTDHPDTQGSGSHVNAVRYRNLKLRAELQKRGTRSAKRLLHRRSGRESRFARDVNHRISKTIVAEAERTGRGIAREDLEGIRERARSRKPSGRRCTPGASPSWELSSTTRPSERASQWKSSTPLTPPSAARAAGTSTRTTVPPGTVFVAPDAVYRCRPTGTQPSTSPSWA